MLPRSLRNCVVVSTALCFMLSAVARSEPLSSEEAWRVIDARDQSLRSMEASLRVFLASVPRDEATAIRDRWLKEVTTLSDANTDAVVAMQKVWPAIKDGNWPRVNVWWREGRFKTTTTGMSRFPLVQQWDGTRYVEIADSGATNQVSLYAEPTGKSRFGPEELGIVLAGRKFLVDPQIRATPEGYELACPHVSEARLSMIKRFDKKLGFVYQGSTFGGEIIDENWFVRHADEQSYRWPRLIFSYRKGSGDSSSIAVVIVDDLTVNGRVDDRDLDISKAYPPVILIDYRQRPPITIDNPKWIEKVLHGDRPPATKD